MFKSLLLLLCFTSFSLSFQIGARVPWRHQTSSSLSRPLTAALEDNDVPQEYLTPVQVKTLRKDASKRKARKQLATHVLSENESIPVSESSMLAIVSLFHENELVQVRGISREEKRHVRSDSERLALDIEMEFSKEKRAVFLLDCKGHAAVYYSPAGEMELRSGYREGQWTKKPRPKRDSRGQIIKGEYE